MASQYVSLFLLFERLDRNDEDRHLKWRLIYDMQSVPHVCDMIRTNGVKLQSMGMYIVLVA